MYQPPPHGPGPQQVFTTNVLCKQGKLVIDERVIQVVGPFNKLIWTIPRSTVTGVQLGPGVFMNDIIFHSASGSYTAQGVAKKKAQEIAQNIQAAF